MSAVTAGAAAGALAAVAAPFLAGLTLTVPDRDNRQWYRGARASSGRVLGVAAVGTVCAGLAGAAVGWSPAWPAWFALAVVLTPLAVIDAEHHRLPDRLLGSGYLAGAGLLAGAALAEHDAGRLVRTATCAAVAYAAFLVMRLVSARSLGHGDVNLAGLLGGYLGWLGVGQAVIGLYAGFVIGALAAGALLVARRAHWRSEFAFGPALMLGALLVAAFG